MCCFGMVASCRYPTSGIIIKRFIVEFIENSYSALNDGPSIRETMVTKSDNNLISICKYVIVLALRSASLVEDRLCHKTVILESHAGCTHL